MTEESVGLWRMLAEADSGYLVNLTEALHNLAIDLHESGRGASARRASEEERRILATLA